MRPSTSVHRLLGVSFAVVLAGAAAAPLAASAAYPERAIHIVVPYAAGGPVDVTARAMGERMSRQLGQAVVVENRSGGNATIGTDYVARAEPDGYTLLLAAPAHTANPSLMKSVSYDPVKSFEPISLAIVQPLFVVVHQSVEANSLQELIDLLKANPSKYNYGTSGTGGPQHLMGEMFKAATGTDILHVPYRGAAPAAVALLAGDTQISFGTPTNTMPHVQAGNLKALAVSTAERSVFGPDVPTLTELGYDGFDYFSWTGLLAPAGTPPEIIATLHQAVRSALDDPGVKAIFDKQGMSIVGSTPAEFREFLEVDVERASRIIQETGLQPE